jgi:hypothetical protein
MFKTITYKDLFKIYIYDKKLFNIVLLRHLKNSDFNITASPNTFKNFVYSDTKQVITYNSRNSFPQTHSVYTFNHSEKLRDFINDNLSEVVGLLPELKKHLSTVIGVNSFDLPTILKSVKFSGNTLCSNYLNSYIRRNIHLWNSNSLSCFQELLRVDGKQVYLGDHLLEGKLPKFLRDLVRDKLSNKFSYEKEDGLFFSVDDYTPIYYKDRSVPYHHDHIKRVGKEYYIFINDKFHSKHNCFEEARLEFLGEQYTTSYKGFTINPNEEEDTYPCHIPLQDTMFDTTLGILPIVPQETEESFVGEIGLEKRDADVFDFQEIKDSFRKNGRVVKNVLLDVAPHYRKKYLTEEQYLKKVA